MKYILIVFTIIISFYACDNSTEPKSETLKLVLSADKMTGVAPLTVNFSGKIEGDVQGIISQVPDYFFFSQIGQSVIPYSIPDTSKSLVATWNSTKIYPAGQYKTVLLFQGIKDNQNFNLYSDTLIIIVN